MYLEGYSAWISTSSTPGLELREFDIAVDRHKRRVTCWIPSEAGMNFTVHWADHGWTITTATFIKLDGYTVPGHFLMGKGHAARSNVRAGVTTVRPFTFAEITEESANATPTNTNPAELGTIIVKIKRVEIVGKHGANTPLVPGPPVAGRHSFGEPPVGIGFGREEMGPAQLPTTWKVKPYDKRNPGTYVTFVFRYRSRNFLISQGIMSETDHIHTSVYTNITNENADAANRTRRAEPQHDEPPHDKPHHAESQGAESQYAESQYADSQYADSQYEDSQYAESVPPSPTESSPPGTPAPSMLSGPGTPGSVHSLGNVRPGRRPMSGRSVSLGQPPSRPLSAFSDGQPGSDSSRHSLPHPLIPPHLRERQDSPGVRSSGTRRVVSYDAATIRTLSAQGQRPTSATAGAVSYYDLSHETSVDSSHGSPTAKSSFSSKQSFEVHASDEPHHTYSHTAPNAYLSSGYPGAVDPDAPRAQETPVAPYDKLNVIVIHDGLRGEKTIRHYGGAATPAAQEKTSDERRVPSEPSILTLAEDSAKESESEPYQFPDVPEEILAHYAALPPQNGSSRRGSEEYTPSRSASTSSSSNRATRRPSVGATKGPSAKALAAEVKRAAQEEAARAEQVQLDAARRRGYTPAVPIPKNLVFVDGDGGRLLSAPQTQTPPIRPPHLPSNRKASGERVYR